MRRMVTFAPAKLVRSAPSSERWTPPTSSRKLGPVMLRMLKPVATPEVNSSSCDGATGTAACCRLRGTARATARTARTEQIAAAASRRRLRTSVSGFADVSSSSSFFFSSCFFSGRDASLGTRSMSCCGATRGASGGAIWGDVIQTW